MNHTKESYPYFSHQKLHKNSLCHFNLIFILLQSTHHNVTKLHAVQYNKRIPHHS